MLAESYRYSRKANLQKANAKVLQLADMKVAREFGISADIIGGEERLFDDFVLNDNHYFNPL